MEPPKQFHADQRIRRQATFKELAENGKFVRGELFYLWVGSQGESGKGRAKKRPMIGIVVSRKADPRATGRNLWKRRVREIFRANQGSLDPQTVCLVKIRSTPKKTSFVAMEEDLIKLFKKAGVWA